MEHLLKHNLIDIQVFRIAKFNKLNLIIIKLNNNPIMIKTTNKQNYD